MTGASRDTGAATARRLALEGAAAPIAYHCFLAPVGDVVADIDSERPRPVVPAADSGETRKRSMRRSTLWSSVAWT